MRVYGRMMCTQLTRIGQPGLADVMSVSAVTRCVPAFRRCETAMEDTSSFLQIRRLLCLRRQGRYHGIARRLCISVSIRPPLGPSGRQPSYLSAYSTDRQLARPPTYTPALPTIKMTMNTNMPVEMLTKMKMHANVHMTRGMMQAEVKCIGENRV